MSEHISEELPRLLTGDANREVVMSAAAHLRVCPDCQQELVSAVIAHASLTSAHRFAPEIVAPEGEELPIGGRHAGDDDDSTPLPDLSSVFAQARADADSAAQSPTRHRHRLIGVAAAAVIVVGGGVAGGLIATNGSSTPSAQTVQLAAFGTASRPNTTAKVTIAGSRLRIDATSLPKLDRKHIYELWVTDSKRINMQPVGTFGSDNRAEMTLPKNVMSKYSDFEVSVQKASQLNKYSGRSVLRGDYS